MLTLCPLCTNHPLNSQQTTKPLGAVIECKWCGEYWIDHTAAARCKGEFADELWKLSAIVNEKKSQGLEVALFPRQDQIPSDAPKGSIGIPEVLASFPQSIADRLDRVLMNLERQTRHLGQAVPLREENRPMLFSQNTDEITFILRQLADAGYLTGYHSTFPCIVVLTGKGLIRVADLQRGVFGPLNKQVFVAMSFDKSLDSAYADGVKQAIENCGYKALRVDAKEHNEKICDVIVAEIRNSKFIVADFTLHRGGVYFEAGLMMGLGRPAIFTCRSDEIGKAHFDTRQYNHIVWDNPGDLREKLKRRIQATIV